ncbi:DNA-processing protein DprA [Thermus caliditerrae]|uniref:DNA-processing protein DprA n=1 Tax=Thermus caliditerrae TaxID=1330700 RepID=UPI00056EB09D|nr:DNA-processing protein DprA [Thermus caliditerrae]
MELRLQRVNPEEEAYPRRLRELGPKGRPPPLYILGQESLLNPKQALAVIGSRNADPQALQLAWEAGYYFADNGYAVVSGLARGVDLEATLGALEVGQAVAVVPYGLESLEARRALKRFGPYLEGKLVLVSELEPQVPWQARFAMMRNRLVVSLADAVLVAQTGLKETERDGRKVKSGTWDAVEKARQLGRPVFVLDLPLEGNQALILAGLAEPLPPGREGFYRLEDRLFSGKEREKKPQAEVIQPPLFLD